MYDELIKRLRASCESCKLWDGYKCCLKGECTAQTRLQAADAIEELSAAVEGYESSTNMALVEKDGKTVVEFQPKWIPVTERLPGILHTVIISGRMKYAWETNYFRFVDVATYTEGEFFETFNDWYEGQDEFEITHWMPLPDPPKEET